MFCGTDWAYGKRHAQANANYTGQPWVLWMYNRNVYCERATERDLSGQSGRMRDGGEIVNPQPEKDRVA